jgi:hypothetical protein
LVDNYGYFHMYSHEDVITELMQFEPRIKPHKGKFFLNACP